ncbi:hypothetical protein [Gracilibacillus suaedae]|uniref:hypothetical protein n=1 Tax=Gracilibacillus suaedae TaxID=2820273 RepID=UPI001ABDA4FB|nr:hypothetical protein [Gracilibacillus suaedae]
MSVEVMSVIIAALALLVAYQGYQLKKQTNSDHNLKSDTKNDTELRTSLQYISRGVDDIKVDLRANEKITQEVAERVTRVEESAKQAHKRIDNLQGKEG